MQEYNVTVFGEIFWLWRQYLYWYYRAGGSFGLIVTLFAIIIHLRQ